MVEDGPGAWIYIIVYTDNRRDTNCNSPTNRIIEDPIVVRVGTVKQDTVITFSAVLDRVDISVSLSNAISVTV